MTTTPRQQTFATMAIAGMFGASIGWGFLHRDTQSATETAAARSSSANSSAAGPATVVAPSGARTQLVGLEPATGEPGLPGLRTAHHAPGAVGRVAGPFDDRFTISRLVLRHGAGHHEAAGGPPDQSEVFAIRVPRRLLPATASAAVGVPVLVNE